MLASALRVGVRGRAGARRLSTIGGGEDILQASVGSDGRSRVVVDGFDAHGFEVGEVYARGGVLLLPRTWHLWRPTAFADITPDSLAAAMALSPSLEIMLVGAGAGVSAPVSDEVRDAFRRRGAVVEVMSTMNACATFNVLASEDRCVAAALLPVGSKGLGL